MQLYVRTDKSARYDVNFSIYHRPPPFFQRHSGKLFAVTALSLVVAFAYPVTYWTMGYAESVRKTLLEKQYRETHAIKVTREETINLKLAQKAEAQKLLDAENELFEERKSTLIKIHDVKVNYPMKAEILAALTREMNQFDVSVSGVNYKQDDKEKAFTLKVMAKKDKQITDLVEFMTKNRTQRFHYNIEKIELDEKTDYYRGDLKVVLK